MNEQDIAKHGAPLSAGAKQPYTPQVKKHGKICAWKQADCEYCLGTGFVLRENPNFPNLDTYLHYDAKRKEIEDLVPHAGPARTPFELHKRISLRNERLSACSEVLQKARAEAIAKSDARLKPCKSMRVSDDSFGPFLPWHGYAPNGLPAITLGVESPKLDINECHDSLVLRDKVYGYFCGTPVVGLDTLGMEVEQVRETKRRVLASKGTSIPAEILPGETRCSDGIIRRTTTLEFVEKESNENQTV